MVVADGGGWSDLGWNAWTDLALIRARLDAGADLHPGAHFHRLPLHEAAKHGSPEVVTELARRVDNVDADHEGRTALWAAVFTNRPDNAQALVAAGADPWRPMMAGWSPGQPGQSNPRPVRPAFREAGPVYRRDRRGGGGQALDHGVGKVLL